MVFSLILHSPFQSIVVLGLTFVFIYLQSHTDFSPRERSIIDQHEASRRDASGLEKRLVKTVIFHLKAFKKRHMNEGWNNNGAVKRHMPLSRPPSLSS